MSALPTHKYTEAEYLAFERASETKHEFYRGVIYEHGNPPPIRDVFPSHDRIVLNTLVSLHTQIVTGKCEIFTHDIRVFVQPNGSYFYPDIKVVCGVAEFNYEDPPSLLNPTLIIEVLLSGTMGDDLGTKFDAYRKLDSLQELVLIAQDKPHIQRYTRDGDAWQFVEVEGLDAGIDLRSIGCTLALAEVYARVEFEGDEEQNA